MTAAFSGIPPRAFAVGDIVFDPSSTWTELRQAYITGSEGALKVCFIRRTEADFSHAPGIFDVDAYPGVLRLDPLSPQGRRKLGHDVAQHWVEFRASALRFIRGEKGRRCNLKDLQRRFLVNEAWSPEAIDEAIRLLASRGELEIRAMGKKLICTLGAKVTRAYNQIDYLATFSEELRVKSRRIDLLVRHKGTVGSYREELLRGLLTQLLPKQYEASTGFIEGCPRQVDILVWDSGSFTPLFREQDVVVVPLEAVRAAIEVKTTLNANSLPEAMAILWDIFGSRQTIAPIFKGIFAFEGTYRSELAVAQRMARFYSEPAGQGLPPRGHPYMWSGVNAVCVANRVMVRERYRAARAPNEFPQPFLTGISSDWPGDPQTALFLGLLLSHLNLPRAAKSRVSALFEPILGVMEDVELLDIYSDWRPCSSIAELSWTSVPSGSQLYRERVHAFRRGDIRADDITNQNLDQNWRGSAEPHGPQVTVCEG